MRWVQGSDVLQGARHRRLTWLITAVAHYCSDLGELPPDSQLKALLSEGIVSSPHIYALLNLLNREGRYREALNLGELARSYSVKLPTHFDYSLASLAFASGDTRKQREHLEAVISELDPTGPRFQEAAVTLFRLLEPSGRQYDLAARAVAMLEKFPGDPRASFGRGRILHLLGDDHGTRQAMDEVVATLLEQAKAIDTSLTANYLNESSLWNSLYEYAQGARSLGLSPIAQKPFAGALRRYDLVTPRAQQAAAHFQNYLFEQIRWKFEYSSFRERTEVLHGYRSLLRTDEEWEALAGSLAGEGHHRDAIGTYERLLRQRPGENDYVRAFLAACASAREFEPALEYLNQLLNREVPPPEGSSGSYFQQQHALFLSMSDDSERLRAFADEQGRASPTAAASERHYHHALAALHQQKGALKKAAAVYAEIDDGIHRHAGLLRDYSAILRELGEERAAIELLERAIPEGKETPGRSVVEALAELYASTGKTNKLRRLSLGTLETQDDDLHISIASSLSLAGLHSEAEGILLLALRRAKSDVARFHLMAPAIEIALKSEKFDRVETLLTTLCDCDPRESASELRRILGLLRIHAGSTMREKLEAFFSEKLKRRSNRSVASLCRLELALSAGADSSELVQISKSLDESDVRAEELAIGIDRCLDHEERAIAEYLMTLLRRRNQSIVTFAPQELRFRYASGNSAVADGLYRRLLLYRSSGVIGPKLQVEIAEAFATGGDNHRARGIFEHFHTHLQIPTSPSNVFLESYLNFLVQEGDYYKAQEVLRRAYRKSPPPDVGLLVALYEKWERSDELLDAVATFDLTSGSIVDLKRLLAAKQGEKESLSDLSIPE